MINVFASEDLLSKNLALLILEQLKKKRKLILGCPSGRSLKKTYYYIGRLSTKLNISLNNLIIIMMDEYAKKNKGKFYLVDPSSHYSCVRFSNNVLKKLLNYKKTKKNKLQNKNILFPDINKPYTFDKKIKKMGGIDIFLLASGSTDGHVAFNNKNTKINSKCHIEKLVLKQRIDNMKTFPNFKNIKEVPIYGLTVGLQTISSLSKLAILVLTGSEKKYAYKKIISLNKFDKSWPSSIIYMCKNKKIFVDKKVL